MYVVTDWQKDHMKKSLETNEPLQCFNTNNVNFTLITKKNIN